MDIIVNIANGFMSWFNTGGETLTGWVTGIIPSVVCLLTFMNAVIKLVGESKVEHFAKKLTNNIILRYSLFPFLALMFLASPMCFTFGRFVEEKYKPSFYDAAVSLVHPITGLFPHANAGELFVWLGISKGVSEAGYPIGELAVRYLIVGIIVITIRGIVTEKIYARLAKAAR